MFSNKKTYFMDKLKFSQNELLEIESLEVRGGASGSMGSQFECGNSSDGCGSGADQYKCTNTVKGCGGNDFTQNCNGH